MIGKLKNFTIASRLIFWFIAISIIPLTAILLISYKISKDTLTDALRDHLLAITNNKVSQMASFAAERNKDASTLSQMPSVIDAINSLNAAPNPQTFDLSRSFFQTYINTYGYDDLILISNSGEVLYCVNCGAIMGSNLYDADLKGLGLAEVFDHARTLLETEFSDFQYDPKTKSASAYIAAPILDHEKIQGVVALRMNQQQITNILEDYTGLGDTGETVLGHRIGEEVWFVAPTRHDPSAAFHRKISMKSDVGLPLVRATDGTRGDGILLDYRGSEVMGVWRYLPYFRWGMVVKMDTHEFFAPLIYQRKLMLFFGIILLLFVILLALTVAGSLSQPVVKLTEIANAVSAGDLTTRMHAEQSSKDEVSILTRGFSRMTSNLIRLITGVKHSGTEVSSSSQQIATAARQLEATVNEQAASTNEVVATSKQISATSQDLVRVVTEVSEEGNRTTSMVESGRRGLMEMESAMQKLVNASTVISRQLQTLNDKAAGISTVVTTINRVADQTNLLSLNAAIEAEKAGESGLGFGVVASEIRRLADQTGFATMDIEQIVREMQAAVDAGVLNVQRFTGDVHKGVEKVQNVSRELTAIIEKVQSLTPRYEEVRSGIMSQTVAAEQISEAMVHLSDAAQYTSESVRSLNKITSQLNDASAQLQEEIKQFKVSQDK